jgi:hypothetical protein
MSYLKDEEILNLRWSASKRHGRDAMLSLVTVPAPKPLPVAEPARRDGGFQPDADRGRQLGIHTSLMGVSASETEVPHFSDGTQTPPCGIHASAHTSLVQQGIESGQPGGVDHRHP